MNKNIFVTGIGTGVGKTVVCAALAEALEADYWKPVQAGNLDDTDSMTVRRLLSNPVSVVHPETYRLQSSMSPHAAAKIDGTEIEPDDFIVPKTPRRLIIEGAGGLMVPLNDNFLVMDLIERLNVRVVLVSRIYLGNINHTLLSAEALNRRNIPVAGIIFNGKENKETEKFIARYTDLPVIGRMDEAVEVNKEMIKRNAQSLQVKLAEMKG